MRFVFTGGGTLGSVTPLIAVARVLRKRQPGVGLAWIGTANGPESRWIREAGIDFHSISAGKWRRYFSVRNLVDPFLIIKGFFEARRLLHQNRPDVVVSAGGFVAVPVVWAAASLKIPVHIHQMDIRPGLANKLSAPFATSVSVAFEKSFKDFAGRHPVWTGTPVRLELLSGSTERAAARFGLEQGIPTVLVTGGGTGAASLNALVAAAASAITQKAQLIHLTGKGKTASGPPMPRYHQVEFLTDEMADALAAANLVVTRAGMGTLTELAALGKPALIIPMAGTHQEENAALFGRAGAAIVTDERKTDAAAFANAILGLLADDAKRHAMAAAMRSLAKPNAAETVADMLTRAALDRTDKSC